MANTRRGTRREETEDDDGGGQGGDEISDTMRAAIVQIVNGAVGTHIQRRLPSMLDAALAKPLGDIRALLEQGGQRREEPGDDDQEERPRQRRVRGQAREEQPDERPARGAAPDPELVKLRKQMDKMTQEREQERTQARNATRDASLRELLTAAGVDKNRMRGAIAVLRESTRYDDKASEWTFVRKGDAGDEELDLDAGVKDWAGTDEGKSYLAPVQAGAGGQRAPQLRSGAGTRPGATTARAGAPVADAKAAKAQQRAAAVQSLVGAIGELGGSNVTVG